MFLLVKYPFVGFMISSLSLCIVCTPKRLCPKRVLAQYIGCPLGCQHVFSGIWSVYKKKWLLLQIFATFYHFLRVSVVCIKICAPKTSAHFMLVVYTRRFYARSLLYASFLCAVAPLRVVSMRGRSSARRFYARSLLYAWSFLCAVAPLRVVVPKRGRFLRTLSRGA